MMSPIQNFKAAVRGLKDKTTKTFSEAHYKIFHSRPAPCEDTLFKHIIQEDNYPFESHEVMTQDGYILKLHRIQGKGKEKEIQNDGRKVIFLQHGLIDSSDSWVVNTPKKSLGLVLADRGYDVWLGNSRGNKYSIGHVDSKIKKSEYWSFSFQQMGRYDVPANLEFVIAKTGVEKLTWIGHSQGSSVMFAALTDFHTEEYVNNIVEKFIALAPIAYLSNMKNRLFIELSKNQEKIHKLVNTIGVYSVLPATCSKDSGAAKLKVALCKAFPTVSQEVAKFMDTNPEVDDLDRMPFYLFHFPSGASINCFVHYGQLINTSKSAPEFKKFDFGCKKNVEEYNEESPPFYDFKSLRTKVRMFVGTKDTFGDVEDNEYLLEKLKGEGKDVEQTVFEGWSHMTFMWAKDPKDQFRKIIESIEKD